MDRQQPRSHGAHHRRRLGCILHCQGKASRCAVEQFRKDNFPAQLRLQHPPSTAGFIALPIISPRFDGTHHISWQSVLSNAPANRMGDHCTLPRKQNSDIHDWSYQAPWHYCRTLLHCLHIVQLKLRPSRFLRSLQGYIWLCHIHAAQNAHLPHAHAKHIQQNAPDTNGIKAQEHLRFDTSSFQLASIGWSCWDLSFDPVQVISSAMNSAFKCRQGLIGLTPRASCFGGSPPATRPFSKTNHQTSQWHHGSARPCPIPWQPRQIAHPWTQRPEAEFTDANIWWRGPPWLFEDKLLWPPALTATPEDLMLAEI